MKLTYTKKRQRLAFLMVLCLFLLAGCSTPASDPGSDALESSASVSPPAVSVDTPASAGQLSVHYIDVGQGDSIFLELPSGETLLIDAGESEYGGTVIDYIDSLGVQRLDYVIATHPHSDHIGGMPKVIDHFQIGQVYMPKVQNNTQVFEKLLTSIQDKGLKIKEAKNGVMMLSQDGLTAEFLAPSGGTASDLNNYSAVLRVSYGDTAFLFTGDAEDVSEGEMLASCSKEKLQADVLKVGHHGSAYSTIPDFLSAVAPSYGVISCGEGNQYNHPEQVTLEKLQRDGIRILRTDQLGTILLKSDGKQVSSVQAPPPEASQAPTVQDVPAPAPAPTVAAAPTETELTVYVTSTGSRYHRDGCQYLKDSKTAISLTDARTSYVPCKKCSPPQ